MPLSSPAARGRALRTGVRLGAGVLACSLFAACGNHRRVAGASASELIVIPGQLVPAFSPSITDYTVQLPYGDDSVSVLARVSNPGSALTVNDFAVASGQAFGPLSLAPGETPVVVRVSGPVAQSERAYTVRVQRAPGMQGIDTTAGKLRPDFAPDVLEYDLDLRAPVVSLTPRVTDAGVTVKVDDQVVAAGQPFPLAVGLGDRPVRVTLESADGKVTRSYTLRLHRTAPTLEQAAFTKAGNADAGDAYGAALAVDGERAAIGVPLEDSVPLEPGTNGMQDSGAVYVLERGASGWGERFTVKATNAEAFDQFGAAVGLSGDTLVVGAPREASDARGVNGDKFNNRSPGSGAAFVFVRDQNTFAFQAYLKASNTDDNDFFGTTVAISGDRIAVGAPHEGSGARGVGGGQGDNTVAEAGAVYVFVRVGDQWVQEAYIKATNSGAFDHFGAAVALSGDTLVVGAPDEDSDAVDVDGDGDNDRADGSGAAYVYRVVNGVWRVEGYLKASNTGAGDRFGSAVAVADGIVAVGAPAEASAGQGPNADPRDNSAPGAGAVYTFARAGDAWRAQRYLKANNAQAGDAFGHALSSDGVALLVGAPGEDGDVRGLDGDSGRDGATDAGAAYVYVRDRDTWFPRHYVKSSNAEAGDGLGQGVAWSSDWVLLGAPNEDSSARGVGGNENDNGRRDSGAGYMFVVR